MQERRAYECRLTPDRALATIDEAERFLRDRGLLTRTVDCALPSLFEACHEEPYSVRSPGFGQWPATKWPWFGEVAGRGYLVLSVHRGKNLLVADEIADLLDPICRAEIERMREADPGWARLLDHLAEAGPSNIADLQVELALKPKELKSLRAPLARGPNRRGLARGRGRAGTRAEGLVLVAVVLGRRDRRGARRGAAARPRRRPRHHRWRS